jgi:hypothetical protein
MTFKALRGETPNYLSDLFVASHNDTYQLLRISLICAFFLASERRSTVDVRRSTQAWLQNLAPFKVFTILLSFKTRH